MNDKFKLGLTLFILGLLGVLSMLTIDIPLENLPPEVVDRVSPETLKYLILINPAVLLLLAVTGGVLLYEKVGFSVPSISSLLRISSPGIRFSDQVKFGILFGLLAGGLIALVGLLFKPALPQEFIDLGKKMELTAVARFLYGGITEELLMRFGFMTFMVWIVFKISKKLNDSTYWIGIISASLLFALGHFPIVFKVVQDPTIALLSYVLVGNSIAGLVFGWLYWKKGLETAVIAHVFAHVAMMIGEEVFKVQ